MEDDNRRVKIAWVVGRKAAEDGKHRSWEKEIQDKGERGA